MKKFVLFSVVAGFIFTASLSCAYADDEVNNLGTITVTAQKTEENLQEVPIAVSVFNDIILEDRTIVDLKEVSYFVPNFYLFTGSDTGMNSSSMRGISVHPTTGASTVGLYIDGVPITNSMGFEAVLENIERIEILRGPQGTLYGKNAQAGVINVLSKKPASEIEGKISLEYGEDNKQQAGAFFNTPIVQDKLFIGLTGRYYSKNGNMDNTFLGIRANDRKNYFGKIYVRATPTEQLEMGLIASALKRDDGAQSFNSLQSPDPRKYASTIDGATKDDNQSYSFTVHYDFNSFSLHSTTAYTKYVKDEFYDGDFSLPKLMHVKTDFDCTSLSEELRMDGEVKKLKWLLGVFAIKDKRDGGFDIASDVPAMASKTYSETEERSLGIFTHIQYAMTDSLNLIGGIRYDRDKSEINHETFMFRDEITSTNISPKVALEYTWNENLMTYFSASKGYKSSGFYPFAAPRYSKFYESESLWSYEAGFKGQMFDDKLFLNADIYYMDLSDMQVMTQVSPVAGYISNAASARSLGCELDANYALTSNFNVFASFGYNETKFDEFQDALGSYKDNYNPFAPRYTYSLGGTFRGFGGFYASANLTGYGRMYLDNANTLSQDAYSIVNAKIGYEWKHFDVYVYADNLFNKNYDTRGYYGYYVTINPEREIGLRLNWRF